MILSLRSLADLATDLADFVRVGLRQARARRTETEATLAHLSGQSIEDAAFDVVYGERYADWCREVQEIADDELEELLSEGGGE